MRQRTVVLTLLLAAGGTFARPAAPASVRTLPCPTDSAEHRVGALAGVVRDARGGTLGGAAVSAEWLAIALDSGRYRTVTEQVTATTDSGGTYTLCGIPAEAPVTLRVTHAGHRSVAGEVVVPASSLLRREVRLVRSDVMRGGGLLLGRVVREDGRPVESGRVAVHGLSRQAEIRDGAFALSELPPGTWSVEVRAIGHEPRSVLVDVADDGPSAATLTMTASVARLEPVTVVGESSRETKLLREILFRKRYGAGTVFLPGNPWLEGAFDPTDVLRAARGFRDEGGFFVARPHGGSGCTSRVATPLTNIRREYPTIQVYLNGEPYPLGLQELNNEVRPRDVLAIEAYPDVLAAPPLMRRPGACAVVAVWTKR